MADDPVAAVLSALGDRIGLAQRKILEAAGAFPGDYARAAFASGELVTVARKAFAAVEAALKHHQPVPLYGNAATEDEPGACPHDPDAQCHFESDDGEWLCELKPEGATCSGCPGLPDGERIPWPCDEYQAILAALTGKEESGG